VRHIARVTATVAAIAAIGLLWTAFGGSRRPETSAARASFSWLPAAPAPALRVGRPEQLGSSRFLSRWTMVRASVLARSRPSAAAPVAAELETTTTDGTPNALAVLRTATDAGGRLWVEVRLPVLPNGTVGWVPRRFVGGYETVNTRLVVDRERLRAILYRNRRAMFAAPVGVGTSRWPTPPGEFIIRNELTRYASPFYGPIAFGTTARSAVLTEWPGGGFVGIHGTNAPQLLPGRVSHGCIRMRNHDILRLAALLPVGTPLTIR
jgi:lipoprotein-anchoring transpeptidase ErfK/SrfK